MFIHTFCLYTGGSGVERVKVDRSLGTCKASIQGKKHFAFSH